jgi:hypothetical protein
MKKNKIDRRKFLVNSLQSAAGLGVLASCDKRTVIVGTDVRPPSTPSGLMYSILPPANGTYSIDLTWNAHDGTDIAGAKTESQITYQVYRKTDAQDSFGATPLTVLDTTSFSDKSNEVQDAFSRIKALSGQGISFEYCIAALDGAGNVSQRSNPVLVPIQKFVDIFVSTQPSAVPGTSSKPNIQGSVVQQMVDALIKKFTNQQTVGEAWKSLFPILSQTTLIGIKINTLGGSSVSTKREVVDAIVAGLVSMPLAGGGTFNEYNIIVFDDRAKDTTLMQRAGYDFRDDKVHYRVTSTGWNSTLNGVPISQQESASALWGSSIPVNGSTQKLSKIFETVDYIINVPVLKDHNQAGITFSMKNLYGIISAPGSMHSNMCNPYIPSLYASSVNGIQFKDKIRITVGDALVGCYSGGPDGMPTVAPCAIVLGNDPVALDSWALDTINSYRRKSGYASLNPIPITATYNGNIRKQDAGHILAASQPPYSLGSMRYAANEVPL